MSVIHVVVFECHHLPNSNHTNTAVYQGKKPDWGRDQLKHKDEEDKKGDDGAEHDESEEEEDEDADE